jgi:thiamine biosynthesis lipoprotein
MIHPAFATASRPVGSERALRRARPLLGTLVEIGAVAADPARAAAAIGAAFDRIAAIHSRLSRFDDASEIGRFNAAPAGACIAVGAETRAVLAAALALRDASEGLFDVSLGSGASAWQCGDHGLCKLAADVRLDLGGIAKGFAVDAAVATLGALDVASGWVNAGGDLRVFGALTLPIDLRDERAGGVRRFATLGDGAFATSRLARSNDHDVARPGHASVAAPECMWADALTKIVIASGDATHPILARFEARAWCH